MKPLQEASVCSSWPLRGAILAIVASIAVGACAATPTSPSPSQTAPASATASATSPTAIVASPSASATAGAQSSASIPPGAQIAARIDVGVSDGPRWFASDNRSLWVHQDSSLVRLDLATSAIAGQVLTNPIDYGYATTGAGALWQTDFDRDVLLRIDPATGKVVASIPLPVGSAPEGVAVTPGAVWVADHHGGAITRVDPKTNRVVATIPIGPTGADGPLTMAAVPKGVFVDVPNMGSMVRIDPATNKVAGLSLPDGPVASDGAEVWIGVGAGPNGLPEVVRVDPVSGTIITAVDLQTSGIGSLAVGLGSVWATTDSGLVRIDAATGRVIGRLDLDGDGGDVIVASGSVWVAAEGKPYVLRISPN
jgi:virginiamycin B lyase